MKFLVLFILFSCTFFIMEAQVNYVKNPDFEEYYHCPNMLDQIDSCKYWNAIIDNPSFYDCVPEYSNICAGSNIYVGVPTSSYYFQYPRSGKGMVQALFYYDESLSPPAPPYKDYKRDYLKGELAKKLTPGVSYCIALYVNLTEISGYATNNIGVYLNNGSLDTVSNICEPLTFVVPQLTSSLVIADTQNWTRIQGSFVADGTETTLTVGNFNSKSSTVASPITTSGSHYAIYLIDDVSVIETNLPAYAGPDQWVPIGDSVFIGRGLDSTKGLDCKWYYKGVFVDSGAGIFVHATTVGSVDTYTVVQTICGMVKTDTVLVLTASVGIDEVHGYGQKLYELFPNPSKGQVTILQSKLIYSQVSATICDLSGRQVFQGSLQFQDGLANLSLQSFDKGVYVIQLYNPTGSVSRLQLLID